MHTIPMELIEGLNHEASELVPSFMISKRFYDILSPKAKFMSKSCSDSRSSRTLAVILK